MPLSVISLEYRLVVDNTELTTELRKHEKPGKTTGFLQELRGFCVDAIYTAG